MGRKAAKGWPRRSFGFLPSGQVVRREKGSSARPCVPTERSSFYLLVKLLANFIRVNQLKCQQSAIHSTGAVTLSFASLEVPDMERGVLNIGSFIYQKLSEHLLSPGREAANEDTVRNKLGSLSSSCLESCEENRHAKITCGLKYYRCCPDVQDSVREFRKSPLYGGRGRKDQERCHE